MHRDAEWADAAHSGKDLDKIVSYWTDDALVIFPGQPTIEGKKAIRAYVASSLATPGFSIHWVSEKPEFSPDGKLAYMRGTDELTVPGADGKPVTLHLRGSPCGGWSPTVNGVAWPTFPTRLRRRQHRVPPEELY